jgi:sulfur carrier protein ThiS
MPARPAAAGRARPTRGGGKRRGRMKITFKLFASLTDYLPRERERGSNAVDIEVPEGASIVDIVAPFGLPQKMVHLVLVNGVYIPPAERATRQLSDGDVLAIWPPIAGG